LEIFTRRTIKLEEKGFKVYFIVLEDGVLHFSSIQGKNVYGVYQGLTQVLKMKNILEV
jgi:hypothetical protein